MTTPQQQEHTDPFIRKALIVTAIVTAVVILSYLLWEVLDIIIVLFAGILLGVFLSGVSGWIRERSPLSHRQALAVTIILLLLLIGLGGMVAVPNLAEQGQQLVSNLRESLDQLQQTLSDQSWAQPILNQIPDPESLSSSSSFTNRISGVFSQSFNTLTNLIVILFVGIYLAFEPDLYANGFIRLFPKSRRRRVGEVLDEAAYTLRWWLVGRLVSMLIVGVLSVIGLFLLGMPLAFILGTLAGLLAFIPIVGPALALIPPVLIAFTMSPTQALYVFALYMGIQIVESYFITPLIQRKVVSLPPVVLIINQLIFSAFFSFIGLAVAAPFAALIMSVMKMVYVKDVLGDEEVELLKENPEPHFAASHPPQRRSERMSPQTVAGRSKSENN